MREILDTFMVAAFVLFMIWMGRGLMLQAQQKGRGKRYDDKKEDEKKE